MRSAISKNPVRIFSIPKKKREEPIERIKKDDLYEDFVEEQPTREQMFETREERSYQGGPTTFTKKKAPKPHKEKEQFREEDEQIGPPSKAELKKQQRLKNLQRAREAKKRKKEQLAKDMEELNQFRLSKRNAQKTVKNPVNQQVEVPMPKVITEKKIPVQTRRRRPTQQQAEEAFFGLLDKYEQRKLKRRATRKQAHPNRSSVKTKPKPPPSRPLPALFTPYSYGNSKRGQYRMW